MNNIVLIGMPGAGKSTLGRLLAEQLGCPFVDTDQVIEQATGKHLQQITDELGANEFKNIEQSVLLTWEIPIGSVIATGGSVIYSQAVIARLRATGRVVYLSASLETVQQRVDNWSSRGFVAGVGQSLADVYQERAPLYRAAADLQLEVDNKEPTEVLAEFIRIVGKDKGE